MLPLPYQMEDLRKHNYFLWETQFVDAINLLQLHGCKTTFSEVDLY